MMTSTAAATHMAHNPTLHRATVQPACRREVRVMCQHVHMINISKAHITMRHGADTQLIAHASSILNGCKLAMNDALHPI